MSAGGFGGHTVTETITLSYTTLVLVQQFGGQKGFLSHTTPIATDHRDHLMKVCIQTQGEYCIIHTQGEAKTI